MSWRGSLAGPPAHLFERVACGAYRTPVLVHEGDDPVARERLRDTVHRRVGEELELFEAGGVAFNPEAVRTGRQMPVFFAIAVKNSGVQLLVDGFLRFGPPSQPRRVRNG
ncbi:hypothetical protein [Limisphaera sp. VF-2]|uniref:hypothetical protein n=1 Tax=Limisphaera sp. VF-2 TaxID=3400418 RepID=UPI001857EFE9